MSPRLLGTPDLESLMRLKEAAGWNQTRQDWLRLFKLAPEGCFGIEVDGALAACTTAICYGTDLAWIGMVLTSPEFRRRGLAARLLEHALEYLARRGGRCVKLDATDMGRPLYERLGFRTECPIERWLRSPESGAIAGTSTPAPDWEASLDRQAFGADRSALLARLEAEGHSLGRPGSLGAYFGPCVAASVDEAEARLRWFLASHPAEPVFWDVLPGNTAAAQLATQYGFAPVRRLSRMVLGDGRVDCDNSRVYAIAGFEFG